MFSFQIYENLFTWYVYLLSCLTSPLFSVLSSFWCFVFTQASQRTRLLQLKIRNMLREWRNREMSTIRITWVISLLYLTRRLLHVSSSMYHLQGASYVLVSYLKVQMFMLFVIYCECWWAVCPGCCGSVCYVVQLSAYRVFGSCRSRSIK
jgi:hypothetical protein